MEDSNAALAAHARAVEAGADDDPDKRGERLVQAGEAWMRAGEFAHAESLLARAVELGGEVRGIARAGLAELLSEQDRLDEVDEQLDALWEERPATPVPYRIAAELFLDHDDPEEAEAWIEEAVGHLDREELANLTGCPEDRSAGGSAGSRSTEDESAEDPAVESPVAEASVAGGPVAGGPAAGDPVAEDGESPSDPVLVLATRWRVRDVLNLPEDELDRAVSALVDVEELSGEIALPDAWENPDAPSEVRVMYWPREEVAGAHERWPDLVLSARPEEVSHERELENRTLSELGYARIEMVPMTTAALARFVERTGGNPDDHAVLGACVDERAEQVAVLSWPPERNDPCWCGSESKYKKCCRAAEPEPEAAVAGSGH